MDDFQVMMSIHGHLGTNLEKLRRQLLVVLQMHQEVRWLTW